MMINEYHIPALAQQTIDLLNPQKGGIYVDATFGGGGHSKMILEKISPNGKLIAFDMDSDAIKNDLNKDNFLLINSNFIFIPNYLEFLGIKQIDGIIADLGVSSYQLDSPQKGFSYRFDTELDMRMNPNQQITAKFIINRYPKEKLLEIFFNYGELKNSKQIVQQILKARKQQEITTSKQFVKILEPILPKNFQNKILSKIFQALRIEVNREIENLKIFLTNLFKILKINAIVVIISYHSLEDRLVKNFFRSGNFKGEIEKDFYGNPIKFFEVLTKKPITPTTEQIKQNPRSRSAKLRAAKLIRKPDAYE